MFAQESIERSIASKSPILASFTPAQLLLLIAVLAVLAAALVFATRSSEALLRLLLADRRSQAARRPVLGSRPRVVPVPRRYNLISSGGALRAPPLATV
ncbi:MAG: hypothetical protein C5B48_07085 [Candidatus Rokuibacteriota bacterium]|nr:MAG: hypothetical protein C5B48_07085 [Candidatus Rokubacteria bacterium]